MTDALKRIEERHRRHFEKVEGGCQCGLPWDPCPHILTSHDVVKLARALDKLQNAVDPADWVGEFQTEAERVLNEVAGEKP